MQSSFTVTGPLDCFSLWEGPSTYSTQTMSRDRPKELCSALSSPIPTPHLGSTVFQLVLWSCQEPPCFSEAARRGGVQNPKRPSTAFSWSSGRLLANAQHTLHVSPKPCPESLQYFPSLLSSKPCSSLPWVFSAEKETGNKGALAMQEAETPHLPCLGF